MSVSSHKQPWASMPSASKAPPLPKYAHGQIARHKPTHAQHTGQRRT